MSSPPASTPGTYLADADARDTMSLADGLRIAIRSLGENPLRTFLTLLGISIGVTAVILVVSIVEGLNGYVGSTVGNLGPDVFILEKYGIIKDRDEFIRARRRNPDITLDDAEAIRRQTTLIGRLSVKKTANSSVKYQSTSVDDIEVQGVSAENFEIDPLDIEFGRQFTAQEDSRAAQLCILGYDVAESLFGSLDPIGRRISALGRRFTVIGVAARKGSVFGQSRDNFMVVPIRAFLKIRGSFGSFAISIKASDPARIEAAMDEVRSVMRLRHRLSNDEKDTFGMITASGVMEFWRDLTEKIFNVAIFVVSISLVVGGIVIMNIMLLSVVERTREIGVRKSIGARDSDIRLQFLSESILLCVLGGALGVAFGRGGVWLIATLSPLPASFPLWAPWLAVGVTSAVGIFFGLYPARQAAGLNPIDALRAETV